MDIQFFHDPNKIPQPKEKIRIESIQAAPYADRFRVFVEVRITPFQVRPNLLLALYDADEQLVTELSIIETMHADMEFTMHIRGRQNPAGVYRLVVEMFYETRNPPQDRQTVMIEISEATT
ncbi:MAG: hypothetical protein MUF87_05475 [Anaerolineae bacterium]|jgi:hypothetical protein|nr:hypothetical protein [Anaerolineae bacterium]